MGSVPTLKYEIELHMKDTQKIDWFAVAKNIADSRDGSIDCGDYYKVRCPCEGHIDENPSCHITPTPDRLLVHCYVCDAVTPGTAFNAVRLLDDYPKQRGAYYQKIWDHANSGDTFFISYMESRGISIQVMPASIRVHDHLRHSETYDDEHICIISAVTDRDERMIGAHRTYLNDDGDGKLDVKDCKKVTNPCSGGHITLRDGDDVLHVTEGVETGLGVMTNLPDSCSNDAVWSCISASWLVKVKIPDRFHTVHIWADKDNSQAGEQCARKLALRLLKERLTCYVHLPAGDLFNDKSLDWLDEQENVSDSYINEKPFAEHEWERGQAVVPDDALISEDGVVTVRPGKKGADPIYTKISYYPIWVESKCPQVDSHESWVGVRYWSPTHKRYMTYFVSRSAFTSKRQFQRLLLEKTGISVDEKYQVALCDYLRRCDDLSEAVTPLHTKIGYVEYGGEYHYVPYSENIKIAMLDSTKQKLLNAFSESSDIETWKSSVLEPVSRCYGAAFVLGAALASPLLRLLKTMPFSVCLTATADSGKSIAVSAALSMWGDASRFAIGADSSKVGLTRGLDFLNDMPFLIEEAQFCDPGDMAKLIYSVGNKTTTLKGTKENNGLRADAEISGVLFMPAESKIDRRLRYDGAHRRVMIMDAKPLEDLDEVEAENLAIAISSCYGHVAPILISHILETYNSGELQQIFLKCKEELSVQVEFQKRQKPRYATMLAGVEIFRGIIGDEYAERIKSAVLRHWDESAVSRPRDFTGMRALEAVLDYRTAHPFEFCEVETFTRSLTGEEQEDGSLAVIKSRLKQIFDGEFDVPNVIEEWRKLNWLKFTPAEERQNADRTRARVGKQRNAWCVVLKKEAIDEYNKIMSCEQDDEGDLKCDK